MKGKILVEGEDAAKKSWQIIGCTSCEAANIGSSGKMLLPRPGRLKKGKNVELKTKIEGILMVKSQQGGGRTQFFDHVPPSVDSASRQVRLVRRSVRRYGSVRRASLSKHSYQTADVPSTLPKNIGLRSVTIPRAR